MSHGKKRATNLGLRRSSSLLHRQFTSAIYRLVTSASPSDSLLATARLLNTLMNCALVLGSLPSPSEAVADFPARLASPGTSPHLFASALLKLATTAFALAATPAALVLALVVAALIKNDFARTTSQSEVEFRVSVLHSTTKGEACRWVVAGLLGGGLNLWISAWLLVFRAHLSSPVPNTAALAWLGLQIPILAAAVAFLVLISLLGFSVHAYGETGMIKVRTQADLVEFLKSFFLAACTFVLRPSVWWAVVLPSCLILLDLWVLRSVTQTFCTKDRPRTRLLLKLSLLEVVWSSHVILMAFAAEERPNVPEAVVLTTTFYLLALKYFNSFFDRKRQAVFESCDFDLGLHSAPEKTQQALDVLSLYEEIQRGKGPATLGLTYLPNVPETIIAGQVARHHLRCADPHCRCQVITFRQEPRRRSLREEPRGGRSKFYDFLEHWVSKKVIELTSLWVRRLPTEPEFKVVLRTLELLAPSLVPMMNFIHVSETDNTFFRQVKMNLAVCELRRVKNSVLKRSLFLDDPTGLVNLQDFVRQEEIAEVQHVAGGYLDAFRDLEAVVRLQTLSVPHLKTALERLYDLEDGYLRTIARFKDNRYVRALDFEFRELFKVDFCRSKEHPRLGHKSHVVAKLAAEAQAGQTAKSEGEFLIAQLSLNRTLKIVHLSADLEHLLGYPRSFLIGASVNKLMPPELAASHSANVARFLDTCQSKLLNHNCDLFVMDAEGLMRSVDLSLSTFLDFTGTHLNFFASIRLRDERCEHLVCDYRGMVLNVTEQLALITGVQPNEPGSFIPVYCLFEGLAGHLTTVINQGFLANNRQAVYSVYKVGGREVIADRIRIRDRVVDRLRASAAQRKPVPDRPLSKHQLTEEIDRLNKQFNEGPRLGVFMDCIRYTLRVLHSNSSHFFVVTLCDRVDQVVKHAMKRRMNNTLYSVVALKIFVKKWRTHGTVSVGRTYRHTLTLPEPIFDRPLPSFCESDKLEQDDPLVWAKARQQTFHHESSGWLVNKFASVTDRPPLFVRKMRVILTALLVCMIVFASIEAALIIEPKHAQLSRNTAFNEFEIFAPVLAYITAGQIEETFPGTPVGAMAATLKALSKERATEKVVLTYASKNQDYLRSVQITQEHYDQGDPPIPLGAPHECVFSPEGDCLVPLLQTRSHLSVIAASLSAIGLSDAVPFKSSLLHITFTTLWDLYRSELFHDHYDEIMIGLYHVQFSWFLMRLALWIFVFILLGYLLWLHKNRVNFLYETALMFDTDHFSLEKVRAFSARWELVTKIEQDPSITAPEHQVLLDGDRKVRHIGIRGWNWFVVFFAFFPVCFITAGGLSALVVQKISEISSAEYQYQNSVGFLDILVTLKMHHLLEAFHGTPQSKNTLQIGQGTCNPLLKYHFDFRKIPGSAEDLYRLLGADMCATGVGVRIANCSEVLAQIGNTDFETAYHVVLMQSQDFLGQNFSQFNGTRNFDALLQVSMAMVFHLDWVQREKSKSVPATLSSLWVIFLVSLLSAAGIYLGYWGLALAGWVRRVEKESSFSMRMLRYISPQKGFTNTKVRRFLDGFV